MITVRGLSLLEYEDRISSQFLILSSSSYHASVLYIDTSRDMYVLVLVNDRK